MIFPNVVEKDVVVIYILCVFLYVSFYVCVYARTYAHMICVHLCLLDLELGVFTVERG